MTLHKAVVKLKADGFLSGVERQGLYVSQRPPHRDRLALLAGPARLNRFSQCVASDAEAFSAATGREVKVYPNLNMENFLKSNAEALKEEVGSQRFAGMFCLFDPAGCLDQECFDNPLPKIYLSPGSRTDGVKLTMDNDRLAFRGLERLKQLGASKIALLAFPHNNPVFLAAAALLADFGLDSRPEWQASSASPEVAEQFAALLMSLPPDRRPDGLFLADDNVVEFATRGVVSSGVKVPGALKVVSHCNWTMPPARPFPVELIGYESKELLSKAVDAIDAWNLTGAKPGPIMLEPVFENERIHR